jgi:hypothetical protein
MPRSRLNTATIGSPSRTTRAGFILQHHPRPRQAEREGSSSRSRMSQARRMTRAAARSRDEYEAASKSRLKPWESQGVSRRTWYRQNAKAGTSAREAIPPFGTSPPRACGTSPQLPFGTSPNETSARAPRETSANETSPHLPASVTGPPATLVTSPQPAVCPALPSQKAFVAPVTPELTPAQFAAARAGVEVLLADMAAETEKRRDWWRQPVPGWADGKLEILGIDGETAIIECHKSTA